MKSSIPPYARLHPDFTTACLPHWQRGDLDALHNQCQALSEENDRIIADVDISSVVARLNRVEGEIKKFLVNRQVITQQGLRALLTAEHQFLFSSAGVAKSLYAGQIFSYIAESDTFSIQFSPDTTPDDLFGAYDIERFKRGEIFHNVEGSIITNHFAFLDEFMDGNDKLLRALLGVLLERRFIAGHQEEESCLHTAIATSNYMRVSETTEALLDRFLYKAYIHPSKDIFTLLKIDHVYNDHGGRVRKPNPDSQVTLRELTALKQIVHNEREGHIISIPIEIRFLKNLIVTAYETEMRKYRDGYYLSPRTISKSNDLLKANALLDNRNVVNEDDVLNLHYLICTLNEPLTDEPDFVSQTLFHQIANKRRQYYHALKDEISPLLYLFELFCQAEHNPVLLEKPLDGIASLGESNLVSKIVDGFSSIFTDESAQQKRLNRKTIYDYLSGIKSHYHEVNEFKDKLRHFADELLK